MNLKNIIGFLLTIIPASFIYVLANFGHPKISKPNFNNITKLIIISCIYACFEYAFKIPSYYIFGFFFFKDTNISFAELIEQ